LCKKFAIKKLIEHKKCTIRHRNFYAGATGKVVGLSPYFAIDIITSLVGERKRPDESRIGWGKEEPMVIKGVVDQKERVIYLFSPL
jgi:hypothetical protein